MSDREGEHLGVGQCDQKKSSNVYKSCPKMISLEQWSILTPLQKLPKNESDLGKLIVAKGFKKFPKVQKIAQCGHTGVEASYRVKERKRERKKERKRKKMWVGGGTK